MDEGKQKVKARKKTICLDVDGTLLHYDTWRGEDHFGEPIVGAVEMTRLLRQNGWHIIIHTTRGNEPKLGAYLKSKGFAFDEINKNKYQPAGTNKGKPIADIYVDDRAIGFRGNWGETLKEIAKFKLWYEKGKK